MCEEESLASALYPTIAVHLSCPQGAGVSRHQGFEGGRGPVGGRVGAARQEGGGEGAQACGGQPAPGSGAVPRARGGSGLRRGWGR